MAPVVPAGRWPAGPLAAVVVAVVAITAVVTKTASKAFVI
jgi:hypothetical protein